MQSTITLPLLTVYIAMKHRWLLSQRVTIILIYFQIILSTQCNKCDCPVNRAELKELKKKKKKHHLPKTQLAIKVSWLSSEKQQWTFFFLNFTNICNVRKFNSSQFRVSPLIWPSALETMKQIFRGRLHDYTSLAHFRSISYTLLLCKKQTWAETKQSLPNSNTGILQSWSDTKRCHVHKVDIWKEKLFLPFKVLIALVLTKDCETFFIQQLDCKI